MTRRFRRDPESNIVQFFFADATAAHSIERLIHEHRSSSTSLPACGVENCSLTPVLLQQRVFGPNRDALKAQLARHLIQPI